jgi:mycothiol synthase
MPVAIRPFEARDYPALAALYQSVDTEGAASAEHLRFLDESRPEAFALERFVATLGGELLAAGSYRQDADTYHPDHYLVELVVAPEGAKLGLHARLYEVLLEALEPRRPKKLYAELSESDVTGALFFKQQGFTEAMRHIRLKLELSEVHRTHDAAVEAQLCQHAIVIRTLRELAEDPERDRKLFALRNQLDQEVPFAQTVTPVPFAWFEARVLQNPRLKDDGIFIAIHGERYVGMSALYAGPRERALHTGLTGVLEAYRRQGIAKALKLRTIAYAKQHGYALLRTYNAESNTGILKLNEAFGFVPYSTFTEYVKVL